MLNKPKIRFRKFTDDWKEKKLSEITNEYIEPVETPTNGYVRLGIKSHAKGTFHEYVPAGMELDTAQMSRVRKDKLIFNITFAWEHAVAITDENDEGKLVSHRFPQFSLINEINTDFFKYAILDERFRHKLWLSSPGGAGRNRVLNIKEAFEYNVIYPKLIDEQKDIGKFFNNITTLINSTQEKLEKAIILKKSMLEKMFPQNDAKIPELRFKGFTGDWEEKYLGDCFAERDERSAEGELISVTINQGVVRAKDLERIDSSSNDKSNYKVVSKGDLAYNTMRMWQGAEGYSPYDGILSPAYTVCIPSNDVHTQFFAYMFKKSHIIHQFKINSQGLTSDTWNLKFNNFALIKVRVPNIDEQKTIANYFENTDKLISSYNDELEKLKTIKKSLLEKMFI